MTSLSESTAQQQPPSFIAQCRRSRAVGTSDWHARQGGAHCGWRRRQRPAAVTRGACGDLGPVGRDGGSSCGGGHSGYVRAPAGSARLRVDGSARCRGRSSFHPRASWPGTSARFTRHRSRARTKEPSCWNLAPFDRSAMCGRLSRFSIRYWAARSLWSSGVTSGARLSRSSSRRTQPPRYLPRWSAA